LFADAFVTEFHPFVGRKGNLSNIAICFTNFKTPAKEAGREGLVRQTHARAAAASRQIHGSVVKIRIAATEG
jgi:hypothetical protein